MYYCWLFCRVLIPFRSCFAQHIVPDDSAAGRGTLPYPAVNMLPFLACCAFLSYMCATSSFWCCACVRPTARGLASALLHRFIQVACSCFSQQAPQCNDRCAVVGACGTQAYPAVHHITVLPWEPGRGYSIYETPVVRGKKGFTCLRRYVYWQKGMHIRVCPHLISIPHRISVLLGTAYIA